MKKKVQNMNNANVEGYSPEFWQRAIELAMEQPKECESCHFPAGWKKDKYSKAAPLVVRVALRVGKDLYPANLGLFCTRCRRGQYGVKLKREQLEQLIYPLFGGEPSHGPWVR